MRTGVVNMGISRLGFGLIGAAMSVLMSSPALAEDGDDASLRQAISESEAAVRAEMLKSAMVSKAVAEGLAGYRAQVRLQTKAAQIKEDLTQPDAMCYAMDSQDAVTEGDIAARIGAMRGQKVVRAHAAANVNTYQTMQGVHQASNQRFCTEIEAAAGICKVSTIPQFANLAGADQNALYLFQSGSGGDTYEGKRDGAQVVAANAYIARVVYGPTPPEQLRRDKGVYEKLPQARAYAELQRRYAAYLSMAAYSLNQIKESRNPK